MNSKTSVRRILTLATLAIACARTAAVASTDDDYNFNGGWSLHVGDVQGGEAPTLDVSGWRSVTLPHAFNEDDAFRVSIEKLTTGVAWYRKTFTLPPGAAGRKIFLEFQGVRHAARVFVNGKPAVLSENGVMAFGADVSALVTDGPNVVAVRCDNSWTYHEEATNSPFQWNDRNFYANYGGINKNVILHVRGKLYQTLPFYSSLGTTGVYVYAKDIDVPGASATITTESQVRNEELAARRVTLRTTLRDLAGKDVAHFESAPTDVAPGETKTLSAAASVNGLHFWSWGYGYLYTVTTSLVVDGAVIDSVDTRTGFRKTEFANGALKLNDRTLQVHGYAQRTTNEWPALGIDVPPWVSDFSNGLMVAGNANLVRWMHVTPSKQDVESCDRVGLIQAMPAGDSEGDPDGRRWDLRVALMRDSIVYNRNDPSIIFYEAGNKGLREAHMAEMVAVKQQFDPNGGRAMGNREMMESASAEYGGEMLYVNKSAGKPMWAMEYSRDEDARAYADELTPPFHKNGDGPKEGKEPPFAYNRNQDSMVAETVTRWFDFWRERPGTGRRVNGGGVNIIFSDSNTHHRGAANYRQSGEVDAMRLPKEGYFADQVMWDGWVDVERPAAHLVGHWNYPKGTTKDVQVISSAQKVELLLNGTSLGFGAQTSHCLFTFPKVAYTPGTLRAVGYDVSGKKVCDAEIQTAGEPAALKLTPHVSPDGGLRADGSDVALVDVEVVDRDGRRCPTATNRMQFDIDGPAEWRGGIAIGPDNYILAKSLPVELGVNRVTVRSTTTAGAITIRATADGLTAATATVESKSVGANDHATPGANLKPSLARGPTPRGDSVTSTRVPLTIATVRTADATSDAGRATTDDDEATSWSSGGMLNDAWIEYDLGKPADVSEVTLRLGGFRTTSYPLRVSVDGKEAFVGATPRSLGYVTLTFKQPMRGRTVRVALVAPTRQNDDFDITEVTGMKLNAGVDEKGGKSTTLTIAEAELYGPLSSR